MDPLMEDGFFTFEDLPGTKGATMVPQAVQLNFELNVLHEHTTGWTPGGKWWHGEKGFPYGGTTGDGRSTPAGPAPTTARSQTNQPKTAKAKPSTPAGQAPKPQTRPKEPVDPRFAFMAENFFVQAQDAGIGGDRDVAVSGLNVMMLDARNEQEDALVKGYLSKLGATGLR